MSTSPLSRPPRLAVCSWSLRPADPAALVAGVRACGLSAVQLALTPLAESPGIWGDAVDRLRDVGIAIVSGMLETVGEDYSTIARIAATGGVRPDATWPATAARAERVAEVAARRAIGLVTFHAGFLPHDRSDPERATMLERLRTVARLFGERGVDIAFETGQEPATTLVECLAELGEANVGVNFDPANMILYGSGEPVEALRLLAPHVRQVHVKDAVPAADGSARGAWGSEVEAGTGRVAWPEFFAALATCPRRPNLVIERESGETRVDDVRRAVAFIEGMMSATPKKEFSRRHGGSAKGD